MQREWEAAPAQTLEKAQPEWQFHFLWWLNTSCNLQFQFLMFLCHDAEKEILRTTERWLDIERLADFFLKSSLDFSVYTVWCGTKPKITWRKYEHKSGDLKFKVVDQSVTCPIDWTLVACPLALSCCWYTQVRKHSTEMKEWVNKPGGRNSQGWGALESKHTTFQIPMSLKN